jgi:DNA-binding NarL/FixJ family response regulator
MPRVLSDILRETLGRQPDIRVVGEAASGAELQDAVSDLDADVVITGLGAADNRALCQLLLVRHPGVSVIGIPDDRSGASRWQLRLDEVSLGDVSPDGLVEAIRLMMATRWKEEP